MIRTISRGLSDIEELKRVKMEEERHRNEATTFLNILQPNIAFDWSKLPETVLSLSLFADLGFPGLLVVHQDDRKVVFPNNVEMLCNIQSDS